MLLIPVMYLRGGTVLKPSGSGGPPVKSDPLELAKDWLNAGVELIHIIDLDMPASGETPNIDILKKIDTKLKIAFEIEGNLRSADTAKHYFNAGAMRITLGTIAYQKPAFLAELCKAFAGKIAAHIDVRRGKVAIKGWSVATNKTALDYVAQFKEAGINTIYYSDTEEEGLLKDADFLRIRDFLRKAFVKCVHTQDVSKPADIEQLIMLEPYGLTGTLLSHSLYEERIDLEATITLAKERSQGGMDEPTYTEQ